MAEKMNKKTKQIVSFGALVVAVLLVFQIYTGVMDDTNDVVDNPPVTTQTVSTDIGYNVTPTLEGWQVTGNVVQGGTSTPFTLTVPRSLSGTITIR